MSGKEYLQQMEEDKANFVLVCKESVVFTTITTNTIDDFPKNFKGFWMNIVDNFPNELPCVRSIIHHIDLIPQSGFPNKVAYIVTPKENEEIKKHVQELLDKWLVTEKD